MGTNRKTIFLFFYFIKGLNGTQTQHKKIIKIVIIIIIKLVLNKLTIQVNIHAPSRIANVV